MRNVIGHHRPSSPLIERQYISSDLEKEIRYSCYRLQRNIERGIPSCDIRQKPEETVENKDTSAWGLKNGTRSQSSSLPPTLRPQKDRHDSGVGIEVQQTATDGIGIFQQIGCCRLERHGYDPCYATSSVPSSTNGTSGQVDLPYSSGETLIGNELRVSQERQCTGQHSNIGASTGTENDVCSEKFLDSETNSMPCIAPNLSRPPVTSRLVRKKRVENLHGASVQESLDDGISNAESSARSRYSWIPKTGIRPASAMDLGTIYRQHSAREAIIIDSNGLRHAMTAAEAKERHRDLQQAVREKMYSGQIGSKPTYTSMNNNSSNNHNKRSSSPLPCLDVSHEEHVSTGPTEPSQMSKRKSILRRLSFLAFGREKTDTPRKQKTDMLRNRASVGFSRIMEAV